mmetsp:Transcript_5447/g.7281  ORF Transcript_5447/g.7281 Transcript_5447/m.7281 type:complete len:85 (-) Transcript_5447:684-938(-)
MDPNVIESTNRQIRSIEKLSNEVKSSMKAQSKRTPNKKAAKDNLFSMSASESANEHIAVNRYSVDSRLSQKGRLALVSRESILA